MRLMKAVAVIEEGKLKYPHPGETALFNKSAHLVGDIAEILGYNDFIFISLFYRVDKIDTGAGEPFAVFGGLLF
jgi:hypothetical protein